MKALSLAEMVLEFARVRTPVQRRSLLSRICDSARFDPEQRSELQRLFQEARSEEYSASAMALRPLTNPMTECPSLETLVGGPMPEISDEGARVLDDWVAGWNAEFELRRAEIPPPGPLLLHGPTGTGKTMLTRAVAGGLEGRAAFVVDSHRIIDSHMGETGKAIAKVFKAVASVSAMLVLEELDAFAVARGSGGAELVGQENNRITVALMRLIEAAPVPIIATTNRMDALDPALLRRFETKLLLPEVEESRRRAILSRALRGQPVPEEWANLPLDQALANVAGFRRAEFLRSKSANLADRRSLA